MSMPLSTWTARFLPRPSVCPLHRIQNRRGDIEIHHVTEFVRLGRAAGLDPGRQIARVVAAGAAVSRRAQQIAQRAIPEKIERLVGDLELHFRRFAFAAATHRPAGLLRLEVGRRGDVARLLHLVDDLLDQLLELIAHLLLAALGLVAEHLFEQIVGQHAAVEQRFEDRVVQRLHGAVAVVAGVARVPEPARHQQVRQFRHQLVHVELVEQIGNVFRVFVFQSRSRPISFPDGHHFPTGITSPTSITSRHNQL